MSLDKYYKEATRTKSEVEHLTATHGATAGNGQNQVQLKSPACKDLMLVREGYHGVQAGSIAVNGSRYEFKDGASIRTNTTATGSWNARMVNSSYLPRYKSQINPTTHQWEEVRDSTLTKLKRN